MSKLRQALRNGALLRRSSQRRRSSVNQGADFESSVQNDRNWSKRYSSSRDAILRSGHSLGSVLRRLPTRRRPSRSAL
jgi:hypothetical protein